MEEWKEYRLNDVCEVINGRAYKQEELLEEGKYRVLRVGNIFQGNNWYYSDIELPEDKYCYNGDLLYAWSCGFAPYIWKGEKTIYHYHIWKLKENKEVVDRKFLYFYLIVNTKRFLGGTHGSVMLHLTKREMEEQLLKLPSLKTQRSIASILSSLDDKIELNRKINANLEAQAQALFKSWFVDFEPFKDQPFVESELGMIPEGWRVGNIYEYIDVIYGAPYKSSLFNENKDGLPLIRIRDLKTNAPQFYTPELLPNTEYINAGDIVAGMDAEFIPYVWLGEKGVLNQRCCKFKGKNDAISNYYILFLIKPELEYVQSYKTGTTVSHLGKSDIDRFRFITPPLDVVLAFSERVNPMKEEVVNRAKESRHLASLRDTLLPRLMSGELKVNEVI